MTNQFQTMRVKLQPLSANSLTSYNSFLPPPAITQIMMIARQQSEIEKVKLKYKLSYCIKNEQAEYVGEIDNLLENEKSSQVSRETNANQ